MSRTKIIEVELGQWVEAERLVNKYLDRAGDTAWCEVWFKGQTRTFEYRVGNKDCVFPEHHPCVTKSELAASEKKSKKVNTVTKMTNGSTSTRGSNARTAKGSAAMSAAEAVTTGALTTTPLTKDTASAPTASAKASPKDDWLDQL